MRAGAYLLAHLLVSMIIVAICAAVQKVLLWDGDPKLFDAVPLRYVFDAIDLGILVAFLVFGTREAWKVFAEEMEQGDD